ncbi:Small RNA degrading nuclease 5 [Thelohanellus kitauei]|uniref:Small RNA degrading nuclease 5 n=1 Tax=Thelohanellus kitauei TaxID=669202 RepID=A0A0C2MX51_THEKT|nr:Small RNA degrading nuclease 5 [Thelohanellus kitauei]
MDSDTNRLYNELMAKYLHCGICTNPYYTKPCTWPRSDPLVDICKPDCCKDWCPCRSKHNHDFCASLNTCNYCNHPHRVKYRTRKLCPVLGDPKPSSLQIVNLKNDDMEYSKFFLTANSPRTETTMKVAAITCKKTKIDGNLDVTRVTIIDDNLNQRYSEVFTHRSCSCDPKITCRCLNDKYTCCVGKTLKDIQDDLSKLISHDTILIGHEIRDHLRDLKMVHEKVIDTSCLTTRACGHSYLCPKRLILKEFDSTKDINEILRDDAVACMRIFRDSALNSLKVDY